MNKHKVIIDCDPGIDDSLALLYALKHPSLEIIALTIVAGNAPVDIALDNAFKILEQTGRTDIPIYRGAEKPLERDFVSAQDTHGIDGLGESNIPRLSHQKAQDTSAQDFLAEYFSHPRQTSIIALGPLTNIALALERNPQLGFNLKRFVSMGGSYKAHGNCSPVAEYNYWCDPHAARKVFKRLGKKIEMVGLDVTRSIVLTPNILEYIRFKNPTLGDFIGQITRFYWDFHWKYEGIIGCVINDPLAIAYFVNSQLCQGFQSWVDIATDGISLGQTLVDAYNFYHHTPNALVLTKVDSMAFFGNFLSILLDLSEENVRKELERTKLISC